jgi:hypothetical protein
MLAFKCPACRTTVRLPDSARGERIVCGHCGESVFVAGSAEPSQSTTTLQPLPAAVVVERGAPRRRKQPSAWKLLPHVVIAGITAYAAWRMYDSTVNRQPEKPAPIVIAPPQRSIKPSTIPRRDKTPPTPAVLKETPLPVPEVPEIPTPPTFADFSSAVDLPEREFGTAAAIATPGVECDLELMTNFADLKRDAEKLLWKGALVAGLRMDKGSLQFRWMKDIPIEAETAIRNSVIRLTSHQHERFLALRTPIIGEPLTLDLKKSSLRINGKCDHLPPVEDVRFGVTIAGDIALKGTDGANPECMKTRDELIIGALAPLGRLLFETI